MTELQDVETLYHVLFSKYKPTIAQVQPRITFPRFLRRWSNADAPQQSHLAEDVLLAAWLIVFWRALPTKVDRFVELGCGNGMLTHVLLSEGYAGQGVDLATHSRWSMYPPRTTSHLRATTIHPPALYDDEGALAELIPPGSFVISNHADELTPWIPLLASKAGARGYMTIPCCRYALNGNGFRLSDIPFDIHNPLQEPCRSANDLSEPFDPPPTCSAAPPPSPFSPRKRTSGSLNPLLRSSPQNLNMNEMYQVYLAQLADAAGWIVERETLRLPLERNFGLVAVERKFRDDAVLGEWVKAVKGWTPREGSQAGGHA